MLAGFYCETVQAEAGSRDAYAANRSWGLDPDKDDVGSNQSADGLSIPP